MPCPVCARSRGTNRASLANLKNQQRSGLRDRRLGPLYLVYPVLDSLGIKSPTGRYGNVLLAIDFKGRGNTDHAGGCREAPKLIPRARIERPELPVRSSACEYDVSTCHQERRPKNGLKVVLPHALARIQVPRLKFA